MTATLTVRNIPDRLHVWLKEQASCNHRSVNNEVIAVLEAMRNNQPTKPRISADRIMEIAAQCASAPDLDTRSAEEIIGYDESGLVG